MRRLSRRSRRENAWRGIDYALPVGMDKHIVYVLVSQANPARHYVGLTSDLENRLRWHDSAPTGKTPLTHQLQKPSRTRTVSTSAVAN